MKNIALILLLISLIIHVSCSNNSEDSPTIDCSQSDLSVEVINSTKPDCDTEGTITLSGSGGTEPYSYSVDGVNFQTSKKLTGLIATTYQLTIKDADGCTREVSFDLEPGPNGIAIDIVSKTSSSCLNTTGTIEVVASGGDGSFTYTLDGGSSNQNGKFNTVAVGDHSISVTDGAGCTAVLSTYLGSTVSLDTDIMPILRSNCLQTSNGEGGCHNGDNGESIDWTNKTNVIAKALGIKSRTQSGNMPRAGSGQSLTQDEIDIIACWVDDGARNN